MAKSANVMAKSAVREGRLEVLVLNANCDRGSKAHKVGMHKHPSWQADLILDGLALFIDGSGCETILAPGDAILIPPEREHSFVYRRDSSAWLAFWFQLKGLPRELEPLRIETSSFSHPFFLSLAALHDCDTLSWRGRMDALGSCLAGFLEASISCEEHGLPVQEGLLGRALRWIERNDGRRVDVKELSFALGCSASHLSHAFKSRFGRSLKSFIDERRANALERLLLQSELSPARIAESLDFRDSGELSRFCRRQLGSCPGKLRL
jgi:AraC-like DNA-binding protein